LRGAQRYSHRPLFVQTPAPSATARCAVAMAAAWTSPPGLIAVPAPVSVVARRGRRSIGGCSYDRNAGLACRRKNKSGCPR